jgi:hypothetical protein
MNILNKLRNNQFVFMLLCACWDHFWYVSILRLTALRLLLAQLLLLLFLAWAGFGLLALPGNGAGSSATVTRRAMGNGFGRSIGTGFEQ